ncbi:MAG: hypothetical protein ACJA0G_000694 [Kangiellaceae bacterium]|jgi:hypothetical protein
MLFVGHFPGNLLCFNELKVMSAIKRCRTAHIESHAGTQKKYS